MVYVNLEIHSFLLVFPVYQSTGFESILYGSLNFLWFCCKVSLLNSDSVFGPFSGPRVVNLIFSKNQLVDRSNVKMTDENSQSLNIKCVQC